MMNLKQVVRLTAPSVMPRGSRRVSRGLAAISAMEFRVFLSAKGSSVAVASEIAAAVRDDKYEENDTLSTAYNFGTLTAPISIDGKSFDRDWFRFTTTVPARLEDTVQLRFSDAKGDLDLLLYNSGGTLIRSSDSAGDIETVFMGGLAAGTYYIQVRGFQAFGGPEATNPSYTLKIDPPSPAIEDGYEQNDTISTAKDLRKLTKTKTFKNLALLDEDWFKFSIAAGNSTGFVQIGFENSRGNIDLSLYNSADALVSSSTSVSDDFETISLSGLAAGAYKIRVSSPTGGTNPLYSLKLAPSQSFDSASTLYLNFDGASMSFADLEKWNAGQWQNGYDTIDPNRDGIVVSSLLSSRTTAERNEVISLVMQHVAADLAPFGIRVVRHTGKAVANKGATTIFLGESTSDHPHIACDLDFGNDNKTDIAFVGDEWWGSASSTALALADVTLHEAGHTFGLIHVLSGTATESMGLRYNTSSSSWVADTSFLNATYSAREFSGVTQNAYQYMKRTFLAGPSGSTTASPPLLPLADDSGGSTDHSEAFLCGCPLCRGAKNALLS